MNRFFRPALVATVLAAAVAGANPVRAADADADRAMLDKGVSFLCDHQNEDGSFGPPPGKDAKPGEIGITALAIRALHDAPAADKALASKRDQHVAKALAWLVGQQQADGSFTVERSGLTTYRTAIAVLALAGVDKAKYAAQIEKARKWLESAQFDDEEKVSKDSPHFGGWGYEKTGTKPDADLSNTQLALAALVEAGVAKDDPVMKRALDFVTRCQNNTETNKGVPEAKLVPRNDGGFYYGPSRATAEQTKVPNEDGTVSYESYASMTYAGLVSMGYAGLTKDDGRVKAALAWVKDHYTFDENSGLGVRAKNPQQAQQGLYYYYFTLSRALTVLGLDEIETKDGKRRWARDLLDALKARQKKDGSWSNEADRWMEGLPVLATAYAVEAASLALKHAGK